MSLCILVFLAATAALAGCARFDQRFHGSWLDSYGVPPPGSRQQVAEPEASQLRAQSADLDAQAEAIRVKLADEKDRVKRYDYLAQLKKIGDKRRPLDALLHLGPAAPEPFLPEPGDPGA